MADRGAEIDQPPDGGGSCESPYRVAITATLLAVQRRARTFRNQVVTVVLLVIACLLAAGIAQRPSYLSALVLLIPAVGVFFGFDHWILSRWRRDLLQQWQLGMLDFEAYRPAMVAVPSLPTGTLCSMLESLPRADGLIQEQALAMPVRQALALIVIGSDRWRSAALVTRSTLFAVAAIALVFASTVRASMAWWSVVGVGLVPFAAWLIRFLQQRHLRSLFRSATKAGVDAAQFAGFLPVALRPSSGAPIV